MASTPQGTTRASKLALVKCERCRLDKQKCLPIRRDWPTRCDRCLERDFPCSPGKRVRRRTKHFITQPDSPPTFPTAAVPPSLHSPVPLEYSGFDNLADGNSYSEKVTDWQALFSYQGIMSLALKRLHTLKKDTLAPFLTDWNTKTEFQEALDGSAYNQLLSFYKKLEDTLSGMSRNLFQLSQLHPSAIKPTAGVLAQALPLFSWQVDCPICIDGGDGGILQHVELSGDICRAYLIRLSRLSRHFCDESHWGKEAPALLEAEILRLCIISARADSSARAVLKKIKLYDYLPDESQYDLLFRPDEINFGMAIDDRAGMDCLGRTGLHQALDAISKLEKEFLQPRDLMFAQLENCISDNPLYHINQQDILGRTLLHLACEKGWTAGVRKLLAKDADLSLRTVYGSLPLHYAAAGGHQEIVEMLLVRQPRITVSWEDCRHNTALDYASKNKNTDVIGQLLKVIHPECWSISGTKAMLQPFLKAVETGDRKKLQLPYQSSENPASLEHAPPGFVPAPIYQRNDHPSVQRQYSPNINRVL